MHCFKLCHGSGPWQMGKIVDGLGVAVAAGSTGVPVGACVATSMGGRLVVADGVAFCETVTAGCTDTQAAPSRGSSISRQTSRFIGIILLLPGESRDEGIGDWDWSPDRRDPKYPTPKLQGQANGYRRTGTGRQDKQADIPCHTLRVCFARDPKRTGASLDSIRVSKKKRIDG